MSEPRSRVKARVALPTKTKNPCFPPFEEEQHNESGIALNRKNALFAGSDEGGDNWAVIAPLIECCKLNRIDPYVWLTNTLTRLAAGHSANAVSDLMPWTAVA